MPKPNRRALADPLGYVREVSEINQRQTADLRSMDRAELARKIQSDALRERQRKMMAPRPKLPGARYENPFRHTPESEAAERKADEMLALKGRKVGKPRSP